MFKKLINERLMNISMRGISMFSKFLLIIALAKLLPLSDLGVYGLLVAGIGFAVLFVGFNYYTYSNRELLSAQKNKWSMIISNQIYAYVPLYLFFIPIAIVVYYYKILPEGYFLWFLILVVIEHISLEQNRLLNTMQKQLAASTVLFLRSGIWVLFMLPLIIYIDSFRDLETVLYAWLLGGVASIVFGTLVIKKSIQEWDFMKPKYKWIFSGYKTGFLFMLGTVAFTIISTGDKFFLEKLSDTNLVGVYTFYTAITIGATAFIHAGVIVFSAPKIVSAFQRGKMFKYKHLMNIFLKELIVSIFIMIFTLSIVMPFVISWIDKPSYLEYYNVFYIILSTAVLIVLRSYPDTYLYASKRDRFIVLSNVSALFMFVLISVILYYNSSYLDLYKVALSVFMTFLCLLVVKYTGYIYYSKLKGDK